MAGIRLASEIMMKSACSSKFDFKMRMIFERKIRIG